MHHAYAIRGEGGGGRGAAGEWRKLGGRLPRGDAHSAIALVAKWET